MNAKKILRTFLLILAFATSAAADNPLAADNGLNQAQQATADKAIEKAVKKQDELKQKINQNVLDGFNEVKKAIRLLEQTDKIRQAIAALEAATGKFDIALAAKPELGLVSIDSSVNIFELITDWEMVENTTEQALDLLRDHQVQAALKLLLPLQDELVTTTTYLPMATYPDTIKLAAAALVNGKTDKARQILTQGLTSFVVSESVIPLPLLRAEAFLLEAGELEKDKQKDQTLDLLNAAEDQVQLAIALGYTNEDSAPYEALVSQIKSLRWAVKGPNAVERLYGELKKSLADLIHLEAKPQVSAPQK